MTTQATPIENKTETPKIVETVPEENLAHKVADLMVSVQALVKELKTVEMELKAIKILYNKESKQKKKKRERTNTSANGFVKPCLVSKEMSEFLGLASDELISRPQVTKMISAYIKQNNLQDPANGSFFKADTKLGNLLGKPVHLLVSSSPEKGTGYSYFNLSKYLKEKKHFVTTA